MEENPSSQPSAKPRNPKRRPVSSRRQAWLEQLGIDLEAVEAALLEDDWVADCAVVARETESDETALVAYVVLSGALSLDQLRDQLREHLRAKLPEEVVPSAYVPVSALPLTQTGQVDERVLCRLPVIDEVLVRRWEEHLGSLPGVDRVALVAEEKAQPLPPPLHLDDLLPERAAAASPPGSPLGSPNGSTTAKEDGRPVALADGGPLDIPHDAPETLTEALLRNATEHAQKGITYVRSDGSKTFESYAALLERAKRILAGLQERGLGPGDRVILHLDALEEHYPAFWACVLGGIAPATVAVAPSYTERNGIVDKLFNSWELLGRPPVLTGHHLVEQVAGLARLLPMDGLTVLPVEELEDNSPTGRVHRSRPEDLAFLQLTSGSTGVPKCVQEVHRSIVAHANAVRQADGYTPEDVTLNWMPVDHVGALLMWHLRDAYLGCRQVQVETKLILADPLKWLDLLEAHRVTSTWSPNFGYKLVADQLAKATDRRWDLSRMRFFLNGGEQVTLPVARDFLERVAPFGVSERAMQPAYGGAETSTRITANNDFDVRTGARRFLKSSLEGRLQQTEADDPTVTASFIDVGPPLPGVRLRIVDPNDELLPEGVIGRLQIEGPVVTPGYLDNEEANREAFSGDGWLNLGDLGFILDGRLSLTGREKETIVVRGANFYCHEIEDVVNAVEGVEPTFAGTCAVADPDTGTEGFAVFFVPKADAAEDVAGLARKIRARVAASLGASPTHVVPLAAKDFPKTTSGKIQRGQLKEAFEAGRFRDALKALDVGLENVNTLPDWFYRRTWRRREAPPADPQWSAKRTLVLLDRSGLGASLAERARQDGGRPWVEVEAGPAFEKLDRHRYRIDPGSPDDYRRLLDTLAEDGTGVEEVVHLWTYGGAEAGEIPDLRALEAAQEWGACSLLFLLQALADHHPPDQPVRLLAASSHAQPVLPDDGVACEQGPLLGLLRTAPQEWPWLRCRHVDLEADHPEADADVVLGELRAVMTAAEGEVAYRGGRRWVPRLERVDLRREAARPLPFERGGLYLLTGGLGGVAREVAAYLLEHQEARLLLVGRTPLPEPETWDTGAHPEAVAGRIEAYRALERLGSGEILYRPADVADPAGLRAAVAEAEARWGRELDGVIHLAGEFVERLLSEETRETFAATLRPKVQGTWALHELAKDRPGCAFVTFSSANGLLGGFGAGAYAAANAFLDGFAHYRRRADLPSVCFAWSLWQGLGMVRDYPSEKQELSRARGFLPISAEQGLNSLLAGLYREQTHLLVGLDATKAHVGRHVEQPVEERRILRAYFTATNGTVSAPRPDGQEEVRDRFGTPSTCELVRVPELPLTTEGAVDRTRLAEKLSPADAIRPKVEEAFVPPRTALERFLASSWQDILRTERVGIHDNFFELGGDSIRGAMFLNQLQQALGEVVSMATIFEVPTIAGLTVYLNEHYPNTVAHLSGPKQPDGAEGRTQAGEPAASERAQGIDAAYLERVRRQMKPSPPHQQRDAAAPKNPPAIFILSPPRSGSTLLRVMLGGHPALFAPPELELLPYDTLAEKRAALGERYGFWSEGMVRAIMALKGYDAQEAKQTLEDWESAQLSTAQCYRLMQSWMGDRTLVDKTPSYSFNLETLKRAEALFDQALYVHLLRHPRAMVRSFEEARLDEVFFGQGHSLSARELAESVWSISHQNILEFLKDVPAHRQHRLGYEELVNQPRATVEGLCQFLDLAFDPGMLQPYGDQETRMTDGLAFHPDMLQPHGDQETRTTGGTHPGPKMVGDPKFHQYRGIDAKAADRWQADDTEDFLGDVTWRLAESLGYERPARPGEESGGSGDERMLQERIPALPRYSESGRPAVFPLSPMQRWLWLAEQRSPGSAMGNGNRAVRLRGPLDVATLEASLRELCVRHEAPRTNFETRDGGEPVQIVGPPRPLPLTRIDLRELPPPAREAEADRLLVREARRPFDLSRDAMLRATLLRLDDDEHVLLLVMHHIVCDRWSLDVLFRELWALYKALRSGEQAGLPELPVQYVDYAAWQQQRLQDGALRQQMEYWKKQLAGPPKMLDMPTDRPRPPVRTSRSARQKLQMPASLLPELRALCRRHNVTLYMTLLGAWAVLLHRYSGQDDILVKTPFVNRNRVELEGVIGYFANTLVLRHDLSGDPSFAELLGRVRETAVDAFSNGELPFEKVREELSLKLRAGFFLKEALSGPTLVDGLRVEHITVHLGTTLSFLDLSITEGNVCLTTTMNYNADLFEAYSIARMLEYFRTLLESVVADPERRLSELPLPTKAEQLRLATHRTRGRLHRVARRAPRRLRLAIRRAWWQFRRALGRA